MSDPVLRLEQIEKSFGALRVTDRLSLDILQGETHAIIGPNGAGKTTLIHQISGALAPDAGQIRFDGRDVTALPMPARARLGLARSFQITHVLPRLTALDLSRNQLTARGARALASWSQLGQLRELYLNHNHVGVAGVEAGSAGVVWCR